MTKVLHSDIQVGEPQRAHIHAYYQTFKISNTNLIFINLTYFLKLHISYYNLKHLDANEKCFLF